VGSFADAVATANDATRASGRWRTIRPLADGSVRTSLADGTKVIHFASNDYLGLSQHPRVAAAAHAAIDRYGTGSGASRLIVGGRPAHEELEAALAAWKGTESALVFPTGFAANLGVLGALTTAAGADDTVILSDELNHASIIDGVRLARATSIVFPHSDLGRLEVLLRDRTARHALVVSDSVFSMDGDAADVEALVEICGRHDALLVLDEAHAVLGPATPSEPACDLVVVGTLSKTLGSLGGFVAGPRAVIDRCINAARPFIFTTASSPADMAAATAAVGIVTSAEGDALVAQLRSNVDRLVPGHPSPIVPVLLGTESRALEVSQALVDRGLLVPAIRPPTVAEGTCRLRIALSALHTSGDVDQLVDALDELGVGLDG